MCGHYWESQNISAVGSLFFLPVIKMMTKRCLTICTSQIYFVTFSAYSKEMSIFFSELYRAKAQFSIAPTGDRGAKNLKHHIILVSFSFRMWRLASDMLFFTLWWLMFACVWQKRRGRGSSRISFCWRKPFTNPLNPRAYKWLQKQMCAPTIQGFFLDWDIQE